MSTNPRRYAQNTKVDPAKSAMEIQALLQKHGATEFMQAWGTLPSGQVAAVVQFRLHDRMLRYDVVKPTRKEARNGDVEQEYKRRWRALLLILKAKLEIVASGDSTFDREFLADIMLPDGKTVGSRLIPQVVEAYETGEMPPLLPPG